MGPSFYVPGISKTSSKMDFSMSICKNRQVLGKSLHNNDRMFGDGGGVVDSVIRGGVYDPLSLISLSMMVSQPRAPELSVGS